MGKNTPFILFLLGIALVFLGLFGRLGAVLAAIFEPSKLVQGGDGSGPSSPGAPPGKTQPKEQPSPAQPEPKTVPAPAKPKPKTAPVTQPEPLLPSFQNPDAQPSPGDGVVGAPPGGIPVPGWLSGIPGWLQGLAGDVAPVIADIPAF